MDIQNKTAFKTLIVKISENSIYAHDPSNPDFVAFPMHGTAPQPGACFCMVVEETMSPVSKDFTAKNPMKVLRGSKQTSIKAGDTVKAGDTIQYDEPRYTFVKTDRETAKAHLEMKSVGFDF